MQCGQAFASPSSERAAEVNTDGPGTKTPPTQSQLWETFIGPSKSIQFSVKTGWVWRPAFMYYKEKFENIETPQGPRFALSWNWPAALFDSFLWFLYRKMYMFALLYAVAPALAIFMTGDVMVGIVSRILAGASANYLYYWHVKDKVQRIMAMPSLDDTSRAHLIQEEGGVQPYVLWLGVVLHMLMLGLLAAAIVQGPPVQDPLGGTEGRPVQKFF
ncbi:MAG: DUF2628 domain-containing protein [Nitrospirales bacterium]|nr:DUF2628 domain-containing protein [Nitrospira sp.]MDR4462323.1 DUF2628 domain-containing protein [Nitrospirales bacterium]